MSKYGEMNDHDLLVVVADASDRQEQHLERINGSLSNHEKRIMKIELKREIEEDMGIKPPTRKRKAAEGGMYGGGGALIVGGIYALGRLTGWW